VSTLRWLSAADAPDAFPPPGSALIEPNGLLAAGGDLKPERLLAAYTRGIFPWYENGQPILWWSPDPRAVLWPEDLKISRSLRRSIIKGRFTVTVDTAFERIVEECSQRRGGGGATWITAEMARAYANLHRLGWAHSFEAWCDGQLAGGLYGVAIGRVFFGESMFTRVTDASKVTLVRAIDQLRGRGFELIDCQVASEHMASLGASALPRGEFIDLLATLCEPPGTPRSWRDSQCG
jgi:leucyl/phenylalanyl-tRNA--protein transferase